MDDLERYVDILFADYRNYTYAEKLRLDMLNDLLLKKEQLQMQGRNESDAIREVLASLDDFGAPAEGNCLVFADLFARDEKMSCLLWLIVGLVLSVPAVVVGQYWMSAVFIIGLLWYYFLNRKALKNINPEKVSFFDLDDLKHDMKKYWKYWLIASLVYLLIAYLLNTGRIPFFSSNVVAGPLGAVRKAMRFYPPFVFAVIPLWASDRARLLLRHEMGADSEEAVQKMEVCDIVEG